MFTNTTSIQSYSTLFIQIVLLSFLVCMVVFGWSSITMYSWVIPTKGVRRVIKSRKLSPKFVGPYQILRKVGSVTYEIALPPELANLHNVFHVSQLRKWIPDPSHVLEMYNVQIKDNLFFEAKPIRIEDHHNKQLIWKTINMVKVVWDDKSSDSTWELEETIWKTCPYLFLGKSIFGDENVSLLWKM